MRRRKATERGKGKGRSGGQEREREWIRASGVEFGEFSVIDY